MATGLQALIKAQLSLGLPYSRWSLQPRSRLASLVSALFRQVPENSCSLASLPSPVVNGLASDRPGDCGLQHLPASFPPLPCCCGTGSPFLPGRSLGGKLVRPGQPSCLGGLKGARGCGNDVPLLCSSVSGFPDLRALRPSWAQAPTQLGAIPMPLALGSMAQRQALAGSFAQL